MFMWLLGKSSLHILTNFFSDCGLMWMGSFNWQREGCYKQFVFKNGDRNGKKQNCLHFESKTVKFGSYCESEK